MPKLYTRRTCQLVAESCHVQLLHHGGVSLRTRHPVLDGPPASTCISCHGVTLKVLYAERYISGQSVARVSLQAGCDQPRDIAIFGGKRLPQC